MYLMQAQKYRFGGDKMRIAEYKDGKMIYRDATPEEEMTISEPKSVKIERLKAELAESDYKAIKYAEGWLSDDEYAPFKAERERIREMIRELERI